jgi:hypothetical protein
MVASTLGMDGNDDNKFNLERSGSTQFLVFSPPHNP